MCDNFKIIVITYIEYSFKFLFLLHDIFQSVFFFHNQFCLCYSSPNPNRNLTLTSTGVPNISTLEFKFSFLFLISSKYSIFRNKMLHFFEIYF